MTTNQRPLRVAVLGLGFMGSTHLKALRALPGAELAAVFTRDRKKLAGDLSGVQGNIGGPGETLDFSGVTQHADLETALADPSIDAVDICLPTNLHTTATIEALRAGKHVLVEKPMALDGAGADRMIEEAANCGRILMTAQVLRFWPEYAAVREVLQKGQLGRFRFASLRRRCAAPGWSGWLGDPALSGGGAFDLLIHDVDMCLHLFGKPVSVATAGVVDPAAGLDCLSAQLTYPDGATATISGGWYHQGAFPFSMEYTVVFDSGTVDFSSAGRPATLYDLDGCQTRLCPEAAGNAYAAEIGYFLDCCREGRQPELCPPKESADAVKLMLQILQSRKRNGERIECKL